jgi:hypothetical protein
MGLARGRGSMEGWRNGRGLGVEMKGLGDGNWWLADVWVDWERRVALRQEAIARCRRQNVVRVDRIMPLPVGLCGRGRAEVGAENRSKSFWGSIVEVFGLFAHAILTGISKTTLDTPLTRSLVSYISQKVSLGKLTTLKRKTHRRSSVPSGKQSMPSSPFSA